MLALASDEIVMDANAVIGQLIPSWVTSSRKYPQS